MRDTNDFIEDLKILRSRAQLGLGSMALVEKQLLCITTGVDNLMQNFYDEPIRGEEENSDLEFFISPPVEVYENVEWPVASPSKTGGADRS